MGNNQPAPLGKCYPVPANLSELLILPVADACNA